MSQRNVGIEMRSPSPHMSSSLQEEDKKIMSVPGYDQSLDEVNQKMKVVEKRVRWDHATEVEGATRPLVVTSVYFASCPVARMVN